ncbi:GNAT family N-acetyltransferase [Bermanella marisrubri]|uniref:L-ornithine N(alpha)-acyltransferase n=1 Tax=Bermanella marisrubri TaxID=207949 RepID=Q1N192_9GAMM|nr:GNAT family N-acyltransferase [Bermanella marisrubri]EAT11959.1 putative hemolysin [Oceanobacter sp. RED65] [Bermanella marisrubri]QIZ84763.1 GNAT family N-acetyltransferase [Bermanella marisrubri]
MQAALSTATVPLSGYFTQDTTDLEQAFALRYQVFTEAFGAEIESIDGLDQDEFDNNCLHIVVKDLASERVIAYSRVIAHQFPKSNREFYSAGEFQLDSIIDQTKRYIEIGRTCIHPDYRNGAAIAMLWGQIGQYMLDNDIDYLMGCASIDLRPGIAKALAVMNYVRQHHLSDAQMRVEPKKTLPQVEFERCNKSDLPPLLKAYLRMGCEVCGEAFWDQSFNCADVFLLLDRNKLNMRYMKHFLR